MDDVEGTRGLARKIFIPWRLAVEPPPDAGYFNDRQRESVTSSSVASVGFDPTTNLLETELRTPVTCTVLRCRDPCIRT
jgi:hypothetical protein